MSTTAQIHIRRATLDDVMLYFEWANDPDVRKHSFSQETILLANHEHWFQKKLSDTNAFLYILELQHIPAGQIRFDVGIEGEGKQRVAEIGFSVAADFRGQGLSSVLLTLGVEHFVQEATPPILVKGAVKHDNPASNKAFLSAGFLQQPQAISQESVYHYHKFFA
jgi:UDP-2,4-diacetamido-2,4,6-trideoxy-beta-L-altropyranose hydrolase